MSDWRDDYDIMGRPFLLSELSVILVKIEAKYPGCYVGRSRAGTGNLCVYTPEGEFVAVIILSDPPYITELEVEQ